LNITRSGQRVENDDWAVELMSQRAAVLEWSCRETQTALQQFSAWKWSRATKGNGQTRFALGD